MKTKPANRFVRVLQRSLVVLIFCTAGRSPFAIADELHLTSITSTSNGVRVAWTDPGPDQAYTVQVRESLTSGAWRNGAMRYRWPWPWTQ